MFFLVLLLIAVVARGLQFLQLLLKGGKLLRVNLVLVALFLERVNRLGVRFDNLVNFFILDTHCPEHLS